MEKPELIAEFKSQLDAFEKYQGFIDKAQEAAKAHPEKFAPVVAKVVADNSAKIAGVAAVLDPLVAEMTSVVSSLEGEKKVVADAAETAKLALLELELRKEIGELDDAAFDEAAKEHQDATADAETKLTGLDAELEDFQTTLAKWLDNHPGDAPVVVAPEPEPEPEPEPADEADDEAFGDDEGFEDLGARGESGEHAELVSGVADDVSAVFDDAPADDEPDLDFGDEDDGADLALGGDADEELALGDDEGLSLDETPELAQDDVVEAPASEGGGSAMLVVGEGTDDEHVYPFTGEVISLGRGRDNTIQVKNDSKVSRYHCKLFERDGSFYIEDNKSANGTLVEGEMITEKRLLGGEEIIIGETFFRFRISA